jgi:hypothetical protein
MIGRRSFVRRFALVAAAPVLLALVAADAGAQGKGKDNGQARGGAQGGGQKAAPAGGQKAAPAVVKSAPGGGQKGGAPGQAKKRVTHAQAIDVSREVLVAQGYRVDRVETVGDTRVIYYYRGNNGRGKGRGPLMRMVVRPTADRFAFDGAPRSILDAVRTRMDRLGL